MLASTKSSDVSKAVSHWQAAQLTHVVLTLPPQKVKGEKAQ